MGSDPTKVVKYNETIASFERKLYDALKQKADVNGWYFYPYKVQMKGKEWRIFRGAESYMAFSMWSVPNTGPVATGGLDFVVRLNDWTSYFELSPSYSDKNALEFCKNASKILESKGLKPSKEREGKYWRYLEQNIEGYDVNQRVEKVLEMVQQIKSILDDAQAIPIEMQIKKEDYEGVIKRMDGRLSAVNQKENGAVSAHNIRDQIQKLITTENKSTPFSDQDIQDYFGTNGVQLARRTVTKYRQVLRIPPSHLRKE